MFDISSFRRKRSLLALLSHLALLHTVAASPAEPSVTLSAGVVVGTSVAGTVHRFLGVPYADPPERFAPPRPASPWSTPRQAQTLPPSCMQQFKWPEANAARAKAYFNNPYNDPPVESEDCLYLNVYAPAEASPTSQKPVLFWLYGGNLQFGTGSLAYYDGTALAANEDVVVVTINYRTNIFGFSSSPEIPFGQQNVGFLDQRLALQWVQDNIAKFGGDPTKVTLFGESAGAWSAMQLLVHPPEPLPFSGAILQSLGMRLLGNSSQNYESVAAHFDCSAASSTLKCLRAVPAEDIKTYIETNRIDFAPVDGDGTHVKKFEPAVASHQLAHVPIMIGSNANEATIFLRMGGLDEGSRLSGPLLQRIGLGSSSSITETIRPYVSRAIDALYHFGDRTITDAIYTCQVSSFTTKLAANGYTVWQYYYSAAFPSVELFPASGAYHSAEIPLVFGTFKQSRGHENHPEMQSKVSAHMQHIWASFAAQRELEPSVTAGSEGFELVRVSAESGPDFKTTSRRAGDLFCRASEIVLKPMLS